jgi:predicted AlkP superfamily phosphohydrolase/phosphomutase
MCLSTSQDPGSLGVYGFRNRVNHTYSGLGVADSNSIQTPAIWDYLAEEGKPSIIVGVPPGYPPRKINGISVGCFLTPDSDSNEFTHPPRSKKKSPIWLATIPPTLLVFAPTTRPGSGSKFSP